jgi:hypothetical protein
MPYPTTSIHPKKIENINPIINTAIIHSKIIRIFLINFIVFLLFLVLVLGDIRPPFQAMKGRMGAHTPLKLPGEGHSYYKYLHNSRGHHPG